VPLRATLAETMLIGLEVASVSPVILRDVGRLAAGESEPIDDHRASAAYRRDMVDVLTRRLTAGLLAGDGGGAE
jgi:carbon-monoxide dehydrogenase medium subunit